MTTKRAPGAGRKPRGEFIGKTRGRSRQDHAAKREALERAAQESGRSLSQEIEHRLDVSIKRDRDMARRHVRAFAEADRARY